MTGIPSRRATSHTTDTVADRYQRMLDDGWQADASQAAAVEQLDRLLLELRAGKSGTPPRGLYLYGPVGRGKSRLLDTFMELLAPMPSRRTHMHSHAQQHSCGGSNHHRWRNYPC